MAYVLALAATTALINGTLTKLLSDKDPEGTDFMAFRTGKVDERGNPVRGMLPMYTKDVYAYSHDPVSTVWHKTNPLISLVYEFLQNKDYYGNIIQDKTASKMERAGQIGSFMLDQLEPFSVRGAAQFGKGREPGFFGPVKEALETVKRPETLIGVMPAPAYMSQTPALRKAIELGAGKIPAGGRSKEDYDRNQLLKGYVKDYIEAEQKGKPTEDVLTKLAADVESGKLKRQDVMSFKKRIRGEPLEDNVVRLSMKEAMAVYRVANQEERAKIIPIIFKKYRNLKDASDIEKFRKDIEEISNDLSKIYQVGGA